MGIRASFSLPVLISYPENEARSGVWGRILEISPKRASVSTLAAAGKKSQLLLSFEFSSEKFENIRARVTDVEKDDEGFFLLQVEFTNEIQRRLLGRRILDTLSR